MTTIATTGFATSETHTGHRDHTSSRAPVVGHFVTNPDHLRTRRKKKKKKKKTTTNRLQINQVNRDPSRTTALRARFASAVTSRLRTIKREITQSIVDNDVFGLDIKMGTIPRVNAPLPVRAFQFKTDGEKIELFMAWLRENNNVTLLGLPADAVRGATGSVPWANAFIDSGYKRGIRRAVAELKKAGTVQPDLVVPGGGAAAGKLGIDAAFAQPIHANRVAAIYQRTYRDLKGITDDMEALIRNRLAEGLAEGRSPRQIAQILNKTIEASGASLKTVDSIGRKLPSLVRARIIARTEVIRAHHVGAINTYREAGIVGVMVRAEWLTAGDDRVCAACEELEGQIFPLDVIEDLIPLHPQCRCAAIPVVEDFGQARPISRTIVDNMENWTPGMTVWDFKRPQNKAKDVGGSRLRPSRGFRRVTGRSRFARPLERNLRVKTKTKGERK